MEIREPSNKFKDFDAIIINLAGMQDELLRTHAMPRNSAAIRAAGDASVFIATRSDYSIYMGFTLTGLVLEEYGYHYIPRKIIKNTDLKNFERTNRVAVFTLREGAGKSYGLQSDSFTLNFDDLSKSTPELFNPDKIKGYRIVPEDARNGRSRRVSI